MYFTKLNTKIMKRNFTLIVITIFMLFSPLFAQNDTIDGFVTYHNVGGGIDSTMVIISDNNGNALDTTFTDANGYYLFPNLSNGVYNIDFSTTKTPGGVTILDAVKVMLNILLPNHPNFNFDEMEELAADIDDDQDIDWNDFYGILSIYCGQDPGGWSFQSLTLSLPDTTSAKDRTGGNTGGTSDGDPDGSFDPGGKPFPYIISMDNGTLYAETNEEISIPVNLNLQDDIGPMGMEINYPGDLVNIVGLNHNNKNLKYFVTNNKIKLYWIDPSLRTSFNKLNNETLFEIKIQTTENFKQGTQIQFDIGRNSAFAKPKGERFENQISVLMPTIEWKPTLKASVTNYPNPCYNETFIEYAVPNNANVSLQVFNISGDLISNPVNDFQEAGQYKIEFKTNELEPGVYFYKLIMDASSKVELSKRFVKL